MQSKFNTNVEINKVGIEFTDKKITAYGGFSLLALFFERIKLKENLQKIIALGGFCMKNFYATEAAMPVRVFIYNLFVLFRHEILG